MSILSGSSGAITQCIIIETGQRNRWTSNVKHARGSTQLTPLLLNNSAWWRCTGLPVLLANIGILDDDRVSCAARARRPWIVNSWQKAWILVPLRTLSMTLVRWVERDRRTSSRVFPTHKGFVPESTEALRHRRCIARQRGSHCNVPATPVDFWR